MGNQPLEPCKRYLLLISSELRVGGRRALPEDEKRQEKEVFHPPPLGSMSVGYDVVQTQWLFH